jgi:hypothetical protein
MKVCVIFVRDCFYNRQCRWIVGSVHVPNCNSFLVTKAKRKHVGQCAWFQQHQDTSWSGSTVAQPTPKNSKCKKRLETFSPRIWGINMASSTLITFQRAKLSMRSITHLSWCNWRTFWRKTAVGSSPRGVLFLHDNAPAHWALTTQKKLTYLGFNVLITHPILHIWPIGLPPVSWAEKPLKCHHFSSDTEVIPAM